MPIAGFTTVKVFSASRASERATLGEKITTWLAEHPHLEVVSKSVTQSSDRAYHAITIVLFIKERILTEDEKFDLMGEAIERHPIGGGGRRFT